MQKKEEEEQYDLHQRGERTDEYAGLQTGEMGFSDQWRNGVVPLLSLCDLRLPPVVQEAGVPQRHQLV